MRDDCIVVSIVVVGYNAGQCIASCMDSIASQSYKNYEVIFVDNGSTDDTRFILKSYPFARVISNKENKGFCFANNQAIKGAKGRYVLALNSDIVLDKDFLLEMIKAASDNNAGLFGAKIMNNEGKAIDSTGLDLSGFYRFFDRGKGVMDKDRYDKNLDIFGPCAAAALYDKDMLRDIGYRGEYFDEDFFFLAEDFDLAWRARNRGWKARFVPKAICYHLRNSSGFNNKFRQYLSFRNRYFLLIKNGRFNLGYPFIFLLYDIPRLTYMLFTNKYTLRALREMISYTPRMFRKRQVNVQKI